MPRPVVTELWASVEQVQALEADLYARRSVCSESTVSDPQRNAARRAIDLALDLLKQLRHTACHIHNLAGDYDTPVTQDLVDHLARLLADACTHVRRVLARPATCGTEDGWVWGFPATRAMASAFAQHGPIALVLAILGDIVMNVVYPLYHFCAFMKDQVSILIARFRAWWNNTEYVPPPPTVAKQLKDAVARFDALRRALLDEKTLHTVVQAVEDMRAKLAQLEVPEYEARPDGDVCPVCREQMRGCVHRPGQAHDALCAVRRFDCRHLMCHACAPQVHACPTCTNAAVRISGVFVRDIELREFV